MEKHTAHERAFAVLERVQDGERTKVLFSPQPCRTLRKPDQASTAVSPFAEQALLSIEENVLNHFKISSLTGSDYSALIREAALAGIQGGTIYDAVLLKSASKAAVDQIYTLNLKHFEAVAPKNFGPELIVP